jgi:hypothetical protein
MGEDGFTVAEIEALLVQTIRAHDWTATFDLLKMLAVRGRDRSMTSVEKPRWNDHKPGARENGENE